jgi:hypothetical protein
MTSTSIDFHSQPLFLHHISDLVAAVVTRFGDLAIRQGHFIGTLIEKIIQHNAHVLMAKFEDSLGFCLIHNVILKYQAQDFDLVELLEMFNDMTSDQRNDTHPSIKKIISLLQSSECSIALRHRSLHGLQVFITTLTLEMASIQLDHISILAKLITLDDQVSVICLSLILFLVTVHTMFDLSSITPLLLRFLTFGTLMDINLSRFISLFLNSSEEIHPFVSEFFSAILFNINEEMFARLMNRYDTMYTFLGWHFGEPIPIDELQHILLVHQPPIGALHRSAAVSIRNYSNCFLLSQISLSTELKRNRKRILLARIGHSLLENETKWF